jgi:hypothetical protein
MLLKRCVLFCLCLLELSFLAACNTVMIPVPTQTATQNNAKQLLEATQQAHGKTAFNQVKDIAVSYDGVWPFLITKIQPKITDPQFRKSSQDRMLLQNGIVVQLHQGSGGDKYVWRQFTGSQANVSVTYNGVVSTDLETRDASHLVLEAYQLFLMPAFYVDRATLMEVGKTEVIDGRNHDTLIAVLRPGFGNAVEDRAMLFIDQQTKLVRRVRLTLEGTVGTQGAFVDTNYLAYKTIDGVVWPVKFYEELISPFKLAAHDFWLTGLDVNRGLTPADLQPPRYSPKAALPAKPLP